MLPRRGVVFSGCRFRAAEALAKAPASEKACLLRFGLSYADARLVLSVTKSWRNSSQDVTFGRGNIKKMRWAVLGRMKKGILEARHWGYTRNRG
ncbi:MAG: hypothetical protein CV087_22450 [Candidatus Brocadia sp. WS118]|nr:MAG: hypothetical protein CV087_22450 [Candidatus Brocadia sp. WS118]